jgi:CIC family chloride channel protein
MASQEAVYIIHGDNPRKISYTTDKPGNGFSDSTPFMGMKSLFQIPAVSFTNVAELVPYTLLGILCAVIGIFYVKFFNKLRESFDSSKVVGNILKPALGGFLLGVLALYLPEVLGGGYDYIQMAFNGYIPFYLCFFLFSAKFSQQH